MADIQVLEGSWEEIKLHDGELAGQRVRLVVLHPGSGTTDGGRGGQSLADTLGSLIEEARHVQREPPVPETDPYKQAFGEILKEKYRRMGLTL
jgi:hypothetical protein